MNVNLTVEEKRSVYRILDASANRAREGLRVVEEYVRFYREDSRLSESFKTIRHDLQTVVEMLNLDQHLDCRDTAGDVGTRITVPTEASRNSLADVVRANTKRVGESLRVLEEYGKLISREAAGRVESLRYRFYDCERDLLTESTLTGTGDARRARLQSAGLYLLTGIDPGERSLTDLVRAAIVGGVDIVQLRDKQAGDRELLRAARELRKITGELGALLIINDRPDLAVLADADGVHVGQEELAVHDVRQIVGPDRLIGLSTHSLAQATASDAQATDYLGVGPVFPSATKQFSEFVGVELIAEVANAQMSMPWFAIGGITTGRLEEVLRAGGNRVAVSQAISAASSPEEAARKFREKLPIPGTESA